MVGFLVRMTRFNLDCKMTKWGGAKMEPILFIKTNFYGF